MTENATDLWLRVHLKNFFHMLGSLVPVVLHDGLKTTAPQMAAFVCCLLSRVLYPLLRY